MNKNVLIGDYIRIFLKNKDNLDSEMEGFLIKSSILLEVVIKSLDCIVSYNDILKGKINITFSYLLNNEIANPYITELYKIRNENDLSKLKTILNNLNEKLIEFTENDKVESLFLQLSDCIDGIKKDYIIAYKLSNSGLKYHELSENILKDQKQKNDTPNLTKEELFEKYPEFLNAIDKDGLVNLSVLEIKWNKEGIFYKDYFIYFDDFFTKLGIHVGFIFEFFPLFDKNLKATSFKIKLNLSKIISIHNYKELILCGGMYFGPEFKIEHFFTKTDKTLFTRKQRLNKRFDEYLGNNLIYTDFYIDQINNSFLIEEIGENKQDGIYLNRLMHSEFNIDKKIIKHFDGSVLFYNKVNLDLRKNLLLSAYPKLSDKKYKLFKIDGELDFENYKKVLLGFFEWNEMILEYFDLNEYKEKYKNILDYENFVDY